MTNENEPNAERPGVTDEDRAADTDQAANDESAGEPAGDSQEVMVDVVIAEGEPDPAPAGDDK